MLDPSTPAGSANALTALRARDRVAHEATHRTHTRPTTGPPLHDQQESSHDDPPTTCSGLPGVRSRPQGPTRASHWMLDLRQPLLAPAPACGRLTGAGRHAGGALGPRPRPAAARRGIRAGRRALSTGRLLRVRHRSTPSGFPAYGRDRCRPRSESAVTRARRVTCAACASCGEARGARGPRAKDASRRGVQSVAISARSDRGRHPKPPAPPWTRRIRHKRTRPESIAFLGARTADESNRRTQTYPRVLSRSCCVAVHVPRIKRRR